VVKKKHDLANNGGHSVNQGGRQALILFPFF
jgi:hypothetical protein